VVKMGHKPDGWPALVEALRVASAGLREAARQTDDDNVYFPPRAKGERQPVGLRGHVRLRDLADLVEYVADMLEP